jgi:FkbM family methyltransferase
MGRPRKVREAFVRRLASRAATRPWLNAGYTKLSPQQKSLCQRSYARLFRTCDSTVEGGTWLVEFAGKRIRLPLTEERMWLDWDSALSILGHDIEIKTAYETLVASGRGPAVFFDVGASYGLHSLLFLVHGVRAVSFEPNPACHDCFREICALNGVSGELQAVSLGAEPGERELWFTQAETWDGTTDAIGKERFTADAAVEVLTVQQTTLDAFVAASSLAPQLVKIDTEGSEVEVLLGGLKTLQECGPMLIFESWSRREELYRLLDDSGYAVSTLPLEGGTPLGHSAFLASPAFNFMATLQA